MLQERGRTSGGSAKKVSGDFRGPLIKGARLILDADYKKKGLGLAVHDRLHGLVMAGQGWL